MARQSAVIRIKAAAERVEKLLSELPPEGASSLPELLLPLRARLEDLKRVVVGGSPGDGDGRTGNAAPEDLGLLERVERIGGVGHWTLELPARQLVWSAEARRIFVGPAEFAVTYDSALSLAHPEDRSRLATEMEAALRDRRRLRVEYRILRPDGAERAVHIEADLDVDSAGEPLRLVGIVVDLTERRRAERALLAKEERLLLALEGAALGTWEADLSGGRFTCDPRARSIFGLRQASCLDTPRLLERIHPADRPAFSRTREAAIADGVQIAQEYRVFRDAGPYRWVLECGRCFYRADGSPYRLAGTVMDITDRKRVEEALRESEERLRLALRGARQGTWDWDLRTRTLSWDERCREILGLPADALSSQGWHLDALHPDDRERVYEAAAGALRNRTDFVEECRARLPDGSWRWVLAIGGGLYDDEGTPYRMAGTVLDVTERKRLEEQLRSAAEAAAAADRSKSEFLAQMSHEIRTPMNGVLGMLGLALMDELPPRTREYLRLARESARSLLGLVNDILDLAKIEAGRVELDRSPFDVQATVEAVAAGLRVAAREKGLRLLHRVAPAVPSAVVGDQARLRQVLVNLVGNAVKFTEAGHVEIDVAVADDVSSRAQEEFGSRSAGSAGAVIESRVSSGKLGASDLARNAKLDTRHSRTVNLRFTVRDTGVGIPPEELDSIFESFRQIKGSSPRTGTGLGLTISRQLVTLMGGTLEAESEPGRGSVFRFDLELALPDPSAHMRVDRGDGQAAAPERGSGRLRVLVAEDNPVSRVFAADLLERLGHDVVVVSDGLEALDVLQRGRFDVVLMDVQMPVLDGVEAVRRIRAGSLPGVPRNLPVVAVTAHALVGDRERILESGMDEYLPKPFDPETLQSLLRQLSKRRPGNGGGA